jgi:hypothetical protein
MRIRLWLWLAHSQDFASSTRVGVFGRQILESGMSSFEILVVFFSLILSPFCLISRSCVTIFIHGIISMRKFRSFHVDAAGSLSDF